MSFAVREAARLREFEGLASVGRLDAAVEFAQQAIAEGSRSLALRMRLSATLLKLGRYREAGDTIAGAATLPVAQPAELVELGKRLMYFNLAGDMRAVAQRLLAGARGHAGAEADFAALLSMAGEHELSWRLMQRAHPALGAHAGLLYNRSQMQMYRGQLGAAEADLRQCLRLQPDSARAWWALSKLPKAAIADADVAAMRELAGRAGGGSDEAYLRFALFNVLDRVDRVDEAWAELERGCRAKCASVGYDADATMRLFDALEGYRPASASEEAGAGPVPIFVLGMHRSGTTLLERILGQHSQVAAGGELYEFPAQLRRALGRHFAGASDAALVAPAAAGELDFAAIGRGYLQQVAWRAGGRPFLVDKLPSNFLNIGYLRAALPQARVLHMRRGALDTCFSNLKELFSNAAAYSYDQGELADFFLAQRRLMRHWDEAAPGFVLDVDYEALAREPDAEARRIFAFCGLDWEPGCVALGAGDARAVNTASSAQVREPIHQRGIAAWRRYEPWLGPLVDKLGTV